MTMTHKPRPPVFELCLRERGHERRQFRVNRLFDQLARAIPDDIDQRIRSESGWIRQMGNGILRHVAYPFLFEN